MAQVVTVTASTQSTVAATRGVIVLNPVSKSTTVQLSATSGSSNATVQVEFSLDDPTLVGGPTTTWALLSSATAIASTSVAATALTYTVLSPIGQVSINSTSGSSGTLPVFTLKALQSVTA